MIYFLCPQCERAVPLKKWPAHLARCFSKYQGPFQYVIQECQEFAEQLQEIGGSLAVRCPFCDQPLPILQFKKGTRILPLDFETLQRHAVAVQVKHAHIYHEKTPEEVRNVLKR
jgi:hypothetical protein